MSLANLKTVQKRMYKTRPKNLFVSLLLLWVMSSQIQAKEVLTIVISKGSDNPTSIAVVPFKWDAYSKVPLDVADTVSENLKLSGLFAPFNKNDMITRPHYREDVLVNDWRRLGVQYLVIGRVFKEPAGMFSYRVSFDLYDINNGENLLTEELQGDYLDRLANAVSDSVYKRLTGVPGFFSTKLAYLTTERSSNNTIYRLHEADANGRNVKSILTTTTPIMSPSWSPDGEKLAYVSFQDNKPSIFIQERRSGKQTKLTDFPGINGAPDWSPDGKKMAMVLSKDGNPEIYIMDLHTQQLQRMTQDFAIDTEPRWTPDGKALIFTSNRGGTPQIYRLNLADRSVNRLTFEGRYNARGQLTPDGKHLIFVHQADKDFHIAALNLQTGLMRKLTRTALDESPSIAPNGSMIVYATQVGRDSVLRMVTIDGNVEMEVPASQGQLREPSWSPFLK